MIRVNIIIVFLIGCIFSGCLLKKEQANSSRKTQNFLEARAQAVCKNAKFSFDHKMVLSPKEEEVSSYLEDLKKGVSIEGSWPIKNFILERDKVQASELYKFIQKIPKGSLLHAHAGALVKADWLLQELTTLPGCYIYWEDNGPILKGVMNFYEKDKAPSGFVLLQDLRSKIPNFNEILIPMLQMEEEDLSSPNPWKKFEECFERLNGVVHYEPNFIKYYTHCFEKLIEDNIQYLEIRIINFTLYQLDGKLVPYKDFVDSFIQLKKDFQKKHPDFDFNIIYADHRTGSKKQNACQVKNAAKMHSLYPGLVIGYDLVGEEDVGQSTLAYVEELNKVEGNLPYYFHAGESLMASNSNLYDAVLLKSKRIGHALNLFLFPYLIQKVIEEDICIEVCPISNQVLGYVEDLRVHPASGYLREGIACVLSSDDPGLFGYYGVSSDFWEAVMCWDLDLKAVKQLCLNSLKYSGMPSVDKQRALMVWNEHWNLFIEEVSKKLSPVAFES
jgi:adenosine deaminase CECR1